MLEAEKAVLSCVLLDNESLHSVSHNLSPEDFSVISYKNMFSHMLSLAAESKPIDVTTLTAKGSEASSIIALHDHVATAANINHYAGIVRDASQKRQLLEVAEDIKDLVDSDQSAYDCVLETERNILAIRSTEVQGRTRSISDLGNELFDLVKERMEDGSGFFGHRTGLKDLDRHLGGMQDGETLVLAGRPSMGKSSVATQILLNRAKEGASCLFFSLEMSHHMCGMRMMSQLSGLPMSRIKAGKVNMDKLEKAREGLRDMKIWIDDTGAIKVPQIRATCRRIAAEGALDLVVVDYLQLCGGTTRDGRERDVAEASAGLKAIAKEFSIPVIILSQLNRSCEARDDKRPRLSDLRESGAIEQDADGVVMVYRHGAYYDEADKSEIELIIRKNRNGPLGTAFVSWDPECMSVRD